MEDHTNPQNPQNPHNSPETHPLRPFLPHGARLLMCGTFPPQRHRWSMNFYYPNFINDMWRIFGLIYFGDKDHFVDIQGKTFHAQELKQFLSDHNIALSDTGREVVRTTGTASMTGTEVPRIGEYAECRLTDSMGTERVFRHWRMPSSSRAYPLPLAEKAEFYRHMVEETQLI